MSPRATCCVQWAKEMQGKGTPAEVLPSVMYNADKDRDSLVVVNFVATTRRWYDRSNPRDAGEATPAKESFYFIRAKGRFLPPLSRLWRLTGREDGLFYCESLYNEHKGGDGTAKGKSPSR